jgi:hypothetical protein
VNKSSLEFVRFEAEIENYSSMENVLGKLDMRTIKLSGHFPFVPGLLRKITIFV